MFISQCKQPILNRSGKLIKNADGEYEYKQRPHKESLPNLEFLIMHGITTDSHPAEFYYVFVPHNIKRLGSEGLTSISDITSFTNKKIVPLRCRKRRYTIPELYTVLR